MMEKQIKNLAWNTFKQTGNINTFLELIQIENMERYKLGNIEEHKDVEEIQYGNYQNQGDYSFRK